MFATIAGCETEFPSSDEVRKPVSPSGESPVGAAHAHDAAAVPTDTHHPAAIDAAVSDQTDAAAHDRSTHAPLSDAAEPADDATGSDGDSTLHPHDVHDAAPVGMDATASAPELPCDSTWRALQRSIITAKRCAASTCHGSEARAGGLDLTAEVAYQNLIQQPARAPLLVPLDRVEPGEQSLSLLYRKLEAATHGVALPAGGGAPMPVGSTPVSPQVLEALRLWIRAGAPHHGVVEGTQSLLECELSAEADPNKAPRPPVPDADAGFQLVSGPWDVAPKSEAEVCFATYYDLTRTTPDWAKVNCQIGGRAQTCIAYARRELSQDAQSHHSAIAVYAGDVAPSDPLWGKWRCAGGELAGAACDPTKAGTPASLGGADCGAGVCQAEPRKMFGCTGYGPANKEASSLGAGGAQSPLSVDRYPEGVYAPIPIKGVVLWNSHGYNLTSKPTTIEQYNSFWYARPEQRAHAVVSVLTAGEGAPNWNAYIDVPPYEQREYCAPYTLPRYARLLDLAAHVHKRGVRFRAWLPPNAPGCPVGGCTPSLTPADHHSSRYNDPVVTRFDPPLALDGESVESRTVKFCALYDNGKSDPSLLKRKSQLPVGAACSGPLACVGGARQGLTCTDDASCGEGSQCDACPVNWGVTTEDEMFFLIANYYVATP